MGVPGDCLRKPRLHRQPPNDLTDDPKISSVLGVLGDCLQKPGLHRQPPNDLTDEFKNRSKTPLLGVPAAPPEPLKSKIGTRRSQSEIFSDF